MPLNRAAKSHPVRTEGPLCRVTRQTLRLLCQVVQELHQTGEIDLLVVVHRQVAPVRAVQVAALGQGGGQRLQVRPVHRVVAGALHPPPAPPPTPAPAPRPPSQIWPAPHAPPPPPPSPT